MLGVVVTKGCWEEKKEEKRRCFARKFAIKTN